MNQTCVSCCTMFGTHYIYVGPNLLFFLIVHCYKYNYFDRSLGADAIDEEVHIYKAIAALYIEIHQFSHCYISLSFS